ncbi:hypothetical protein GHT06_014714 [Daphnia sinensis]|uniref:EOG090X0CJA n=1 Tax=Daphnia sinensis TaxID=1820382 RepID=A0AAD5L934_9CRUS|nr:hypothetical protein GHT06_014714 [Daphnia sinensis]
MSENQDISQQTLLAEEMEISKGHPPSRFRTIGAHFLRNKIDYILGFIWFSSICFTVIYVIPFLRSECEDMYYRTLIAHSATSLLRLYKKFHQSIQFNFEFMEQLLLDDSTHNLLYSLMFYCFPPFPWIWLPIFLFALLHVTNYGVQVVECFSPSAFGLLKKGFELMELQSINILKIIAITEVFILFIIPFSLLSFSFSGLALATVTVFVYEKFLILRYMSKQNPFTRIVFGEFIEQLEICTDQSSASACVRNFSYALIAHFRSRTDPSCRKEDLIYPEKPLLGKKRFVSGL